MKDEYIQVRKKDLLKLASSTYYVHESGGEIIKYRQVRDLEKEIKNIIGFSK